jgi:hypothetical protein
MYTGTLEGLIKWLSMTKAEQKKMIRQYEEEQRRKNA